jgi:hypothetical protein
MGIYANSSPDAFDGPKVETIVELLTRIWGSAIGVVSTAFLADTTPIALTGVRQILNNISHTNLS